MKMQELHKAVLTAICQTLSDSADSVFMVKYTEDEHHIEGVLKIEQSSSYEKLEDLSGILCRYGFVIGKIYFGEPAEIHVVSWIPECRFKTAIAEACSIFELFEEDDQTIKNIENIETAAQIISCAMKNRIL